jgi:glycosyltransferase involved in cell wall biosynthesis
MEIHAAQVASGLAKRGHEVVVYTTRLARPAPDREAGNLQVRYLPGTKPRNYRGGYWTASRRAFQESHRRSPFDVAYSESAGAFGVLGLSQLPIPVVVFLVGTPGMELRSKLRNVRGWREIAGAVWNLINLVQSRRLLPRATWILCESEGMREWALREMPLDPARTRVARLGVDLRRFSPEGPVLPELEHLPGTTIVMGGRLEKEKGFDTALRALIDSAEHRDDFSVALIGSGSQEGALRALARPLERKGRFYFSPPLPHDRLPEMYRGAPIYLMPTRRHEGSALSIVEAMACGCAVIASRTGGLATVFEEGEDGLLVSPDDADALRVTIEKVLDDPSGRERIGRAARRSAIERYGLDAVLDRIEDTLRGAIGAFRGDRK